MARNCERFEACVRFKTQSGFGDLRQLRVTREIHHPKNLAETSGRFTRLLGVASSNDQIMHWQKIYARFTSILSSLSHAMSERRKPYPFDILEPKWQTIWDERALFHSPNPGEPGFDSKREKYYVLDMFPYPSGAGLHVGHPEGYTATDIVARYKRFRGYNVLYPIGWDAFGLPAEQFAIRTGQHPEITTRENIGRFKKQLKRIGFSYDWEREVSTADPDFYRWTQWIFLRIYHSWFNPKTGKAEPISTYRGNDPDKVRLAYVAEVPVNWCPELGTVLANEEVIDGKSEVGGFPVVRRPMRQWMLRITAYAERLINELEPLDWPEGIKL